MKYTESLETSAIYKENYARGIEKLIEKMDEECKEKRENYFSDILNSKEEYRKDFINMLGWPLTEYSSDIIPEIICDKLADEGEYSIYRLQIETIGDLRLTGLYFEYNDKSVLPLVIVQHGGSGTPELISGLNGSTANYNNMLKRVLDRGVNVFAPQLLLWAAEKYNVTYDRQHLDARLKRFGGSVAALEIYSIRKALDYFKSLPQTGKVGMVGMSYGGFYTMMTSATDTRIEAALSCSFFCDGTVFTQPDLCFQNERHYFGQAEIACLVHPRKLFIEMGDVDELFDSVKSEKEFARIKKLLPTENAWTELKVYGGNHEFCKDDDYIERLVKHLAE